MCVVLSFSVSNICIRYMILSLQFENKCYGVNDDDNDYNVISQELSSRPVFLGEDGSDPDDTSSDDFDARYRFTIYEKPMI